MDYFGKNFGGGGGYLINQINTYFKR